MNLKYVWCLVVVVQICAIAAKKVLNPESNRTLHERNLITSSIDKLSILENHNRYYRNTSLRNFKNIVLGYVTPWNIYGYTIAKKFANKFTHISPVWYELKNNKLKLVDSKVKTQNDFIRNLREKNKLIKIFPRIQIQDVWNQKSNANEIAAIIEKERLVKKVNGFVFEKFVQTETQLKIIHDISKLLKKAGCEIILVVAPFRNDAKNFLLTESLMAKYPSFAAYSLMTYDYSSAEMPGPNSPLKWATKNVQRMATEPKYRSKILLGLNMYGYRYLLEGGTSAIKGSEYVQFLKSNNVTLHYDENSVEHYIQHNGETLYYPSVYSIKRRIDLAAELGTGLALWELGQGLDYFYDLL